MGQKEGHQRHTPLRDKKLPLNAYYVGKHRANLLYGALTLYGTWTKALKAAGITKSDESKTPYRNRLFVLRELRDSVAKHSPIPEPLKTAAALYFGSLENALNALRTDKRLTRAWSESKIIALLARMHRSKKELGYGKARRKYPALVSAAEAYFGSWGKALRAAGIDPDLYFRRKRRG